MHRTHFHDKTWGLHMNIILHSSILFIQACGINFGIVTSCNIHFRYIDWLITQDLVFTVKVTFTPWHAYAGTEGR